MENYLYIVKNGGRITGECDFVPNTENYVQTYLDSMK